MSEMPRVVSFWILMFVVSVMAPVAFWILPMLASTGPGDPTHTVVSVFVFILSSGGLYKLIAKALWWLSLRCRWLLKLLLGPAYVHGTWITLARTSNHRRRVIIVDQYEQSLDSLTIRGCSYRPHDRGLDATWSTESAHIDAKKGYLICSFSTNVLSRPSPEEGLGRLIFSRPGIGKPPVAMYGYVIDAGKQGKIWYERVQKISDKLLDPEEALNEALRRYGCQLQSEEIQASANGQADSGEKKEAHTNIWWAVAVAAYSTLIIGLLRGFRAE